MSEMSITNAKYGTDQNGNNNGVNVTIDGTQMFVPLDTDNRHYQAILDWVADGNTIQDAD
jgi:hypothetical protein